MAQQKKDDLEDVGNETINNSSEEESKMEMTAHKTTNRFPVEDPYF